MEGATTIPKGSRSQARPTSGESVCIKCNVNLVAYCRAGLCVKCYMAKWRDDNRDEVNKQLRERYRTLYRNERTKQQRKEYRERPEVRIKMRENARKNKYNGAAGKVLERDKYKCVKCGYRKDRRVLEVHHKNTDRKDNSVGNLETLCPTCHRIAHLPTKSEKSVNNKYK